MYRVLVVLALMALTVLLYMLVPRYAPAGRQLLDNADFSRGFASWQAKGSVRIDPDRAGSVILESAGDDEGAWLHQTIDTSRRLLALSVRADVAAEFTGLNDTRRIKAWVLLGTLMESDAAWYWAKGTHVLYASRQSHDWRPIEAALDVSTSGPTVTVATAIGQGDGMLRIADFAVVELVERPLFRLAVGCLMVAWGFVGLWISVFAFLSIESVLSRLVLAALAATGMIGLLLPQIFPVPLDLPEKEVLETVGHALLFFMLGLVLRWGRPQDPFWLPLGGLALFAAASEVVQFLVPGRDPGLQDGLADLAGALIGVALSGPVSRLYKGLRTQSSRAPDGFS